MSRDRIGIIGARGLVGTEALRLLAERRWPADQVVAFSTGGTGPPTVAASVAYGDEALPLQAISDETVRGVGWFIIAADEATSRRVVPGLLKNGAIVVDNSSAFRMDPSVPLVIPEVNGHALDGASSLIANPNCSTIILLLALNPLRKALGLESVHVATYQAVSGAGAAAIAELHEQSEAALAGRELPPAVFPVPAAFNVFCHESPLDADSGLCGEETKIIRESARIWNGSTVPIAPFCMRVPVIRAHSQVISVRLCRETTANEIRRLFASAPGLELLDDRENGCFPTPRKATGRDEVLIGRIRPSFGERCNESVGCRDWSFLVCGDQLRKGAALNALQIIERLGGLAPAGVGATASPNDIAV
jgi:aspartate-semialdehyde dehydrogenase